MTYTADLYTAAVQWRHELFDSCRAVNYQWPWMLGATVLAYAVPRQPTGGSDRATPELIVTGTQSDTRG